ncbi:MAG TPA: HipA domain-containing protein [Kofleriaceae bacterium]|jgi:hypothetical protein
MPWWFTPDVSAWPKVADEWLGLRPKTWVLDPTGEYWLRKEPLSWRPSELAVEAVTLELARRCGYIVASGNCCTWRDDGGRVLRGFVSRRFHDTTEEQTVGATLLAAEMGETGIPSNLSSDAAEDRRRLMSTLELTRTVLEKQERRYGVALIKPFLAMLVFDAWIGNGDRHSANWAILVRGPLHASVCRLAPIYDTAGCLLANLTDESVQTRFGSGDESGAIARYIEKCRSGFGNGIDDPGILHAELIEKLMRWPEWSSIAPPLISFFSRSLGTVDALLMEVPSEWLSERRKQLIRRLLEGRGRILEGLLS